MSPADLEDERYLEKLREDTQVASVELTPGGEKRLAINNLVAFPVHPVNKYSTDRSVYDIPINIGGQEIGTLCLMTKIRQNDCSVASLTEPQYVAYLYEVEPNGLLSGGIVPFSADYAVIKVAGLNEYYKNRLSAPLWGGFSNIDNSTSFVAGKISSSSTTINIYENCNARTQRHQECLDLAALALHATERFLHLYHYLELDYDYEVVKEIKAIDENDPRNLWDILKLTNNDVDRIHHILRGYDKLDEIERLASLLRRHGVAAQRVFYEYGKDSNPLKSESAFVAQFINAVAINREELDKIKRDNSLSDNFAGNEADYKNKFIKLVCYWIYRFRCCIAHNKLGEYHLNQVEDMDFLVGFAEPLLIEMVRYRMTRPA